MCEWVEMNFSLRGVPYKLEHHGRGGVVTELTAASTATVADLGLDTGTVEQVVPPVTEVRGPRHRSLAPTTRSP